MPTPADPNALRRLFWAVVSCAVLVSLSIAFVDRPASTWSYQNLHGIAVFPGLTQIVTFIMPAAILGLAAIGLAAAGGWRPSAGGRTLLACCLATVVAVAIKDQLKYDFGRTWPETWTHQNPSWIGNGAYGFHFLHGGEGWTSFPSGHMTTITAPMAVLWRRVPRLRWLWTGFILAVAIGLFGADFHFIGDMIAGVYLGAACAAGISALVGWVAVTGSERRIPQDRS